MDLELIEPHPRRVLDAFQRGEFDSLEILGQADEKAFFELCFREKMLEALAHSMPTARKREEVPRWFILAANLSLKLHGEHSFLAWDRVVRCGGLLSAMDPALATKHLDPKSREVMLKCVGFNLKNHYDRQSPCDQDTLRKFVQDVPAARWQDWFNGPVQEVFQAHGFFDPEGLFIGDGSYLFVPDNPAYEGSVVMRTRQQTLARQKAQEPPPPAATLMTASELCPIKGFQWAEARVPLHVVVLRETYADGHQEGWALLSTQDYADPQGAPRDYARRTTIEERHRQLKCFHDLTDFHSRSFNAVSAQGVFVLLSYTLRQWQLWQSQREDLSGRHPEEIQRRLNLDPQFVVIHLGHAYAQVPLLTFTRMVLELEPAARHRALAKIRQLEQSFLSPLDNVRPP